MAQARNIEFTAKYIGDWMLHCHLPHHMMNQMVSMVGPIMHGGHEGHAGHDMAKMAGGEMYPKDDAEKKKIPGYPQDMWMPMDDLIMEKPENLGLRKGWTGAMMGMMTLVRVVTPEMYDKIEAMKRSKSK